MHTDFLRLGGDSDSFCCGLGSKYIKDGILGDHGFGVGKTEEGKFVRKG